MKNIMIYTKRKKMNFNTLFNEIKLNANIIMLMNFFISGLILGSGLIFLTDYNFSFLLSNFVTDYLIEAGSFIYLLSREILIAVLFIFTAFCSGLSCVGIPKICFLPVIQGIYSGLLTATYFFNSSFSGIRGVLTDIIPGNVLLICVSIIAYSFSLDMSTRLSSEMFSETKISKNLKAYTLQFVILLIIAVISGFISAITKL